MPRISGVSASVAVSRMRRRPSPRTVARCAFSCPKTLFTSVTLICFGFGHGSSLPGQPRISSTRLPRFAAMSSGDCALVNAFIVARTTLIGLREP